MVYQGIPVKNVNMFGVRMIKQIYFCDCCDRIIGLECNFYLDTNVYSNSHGENLKYQYHFCSLKCKEQWKKTKW